MLKLFARDGLTAKERREGICRENALADALRTAEFGEDPMAVLARAQLYEEYVLGKSQDGNVRNRTS